jgi:flagellin
MGIALSTNAPLLIHHAEKARVAYETAMERLTSGSRVNSASDDPAGHSVSRNLMAQIRGADMAIRNVEDAMSIMAVADGALVEVEDMLTRIYELSVQKANSSYSATDVTNINSEITQLMSEIGDLAANTKFNNAAVSGTNVLVGQEFDGSTEAYQIPTFLAEADLDSSSTVTDIYSAIGSVSGFRGTLASYINRFEYKISALSLLSATTSAAHSRIMDADYAAESAALAKGKVLQQASVAMLAQANASVDYVTSLLRYRQL